MRSYTVEVGGVEYSGSTASAKSQEEMMMIAAQSRLILSLNDDATDMQLAVAAMSMEKDKFAQLVKLVTRKESSDLVLRSEDHIPVGLNMFSDNIQNWFLLIAKCVKETLSGFWQLSRLESGKTPQAQEAS